MGSNIVEKFLDKVKENSALSTILGTIKNSSNSLVRIDAVLAFTNLIGATSFEKSRISSKFGTSLSPDFKNKNVEKKDKFDEGKGDKAETKPKVNKVGSLHKALLKSSHGKRYRDVLDSMTSSKEKAKSLYYLLKDLGMTSQAIKISLRDLLFTSKKDEAVNKFDDTWDGSDSVERENIKEDGVMSTSSKDFFNKYKNEYPRFSERNDLFIDYDNPNAEKIKSYMKSIGAEIGYNFHNLGEFEDDKGDYTPSGQKPVWVFKTPKFNKTSFRQFLKTKGWLKNIKEGGVESAIQSLKGELDSSWKDYLESDKKHKVASKKYGELINFESQSSIGDLFKIMDSPQAKKLSSLVDKLGDERSSKWENYQNVLSRVMKKYEDINT